MAAVECGQTLAAWEGLALSDAQRKALALTLDALGKGFYGVKAYAESFRWYEKALAHRAGLANPPITAYNAACSAAREGSIDQAFAMLILAGELGWENAAHASGDTDLTILRTDRRWPAVIERFKANAAKAQPPGAAKPAEPVKP